ncbi:MAG: hypothetical protein KDI36_06815, partial [Pseudomonadales bacterium]|nr:hypothetical protein [Pseudomonadales bacterium]
LFYPQLPGLDFRQLCSEGQVRLLEPLATQLAGLHHKGIYFRAIHLGNLLHQESEGLALLDISDLYVRNRPLRLLLRARNILHLIRARQDRQYFESFGPDRFIAEYLQASGLSAWRAAIVRNRILVGLRFGKT